MLDEIQNVSKRERNGTHERGLFYGRKQRENKIFRVLFEVKRSSRKVWFCQSGRQYSWFIFLNMRESDCQREVSRSTKLPEEVYRMAFSYERFERAYKSYTGKPASSAPQITIKQEQVKNIRRGQGYFRGRARGDAEDIPQAQAVMELITVEVTIVKHRLLHIVSCPAKGVTYNAGRKLGLS